MEADGILAELLRVVHGVNVGRTVEVTGPPSTGGPSVAPLVGVRSP
jgi:hypothetical protein